MADVLVSKAITSIWCTPEQDEQTIFKLAKLTRYGGVYGRVDVMWRQYLLPSQGVLYHCYQVGGLSAQHLGLTPPPRAGVWIRFDSACIDQKTVVDLYNVEGVQSPRILAWYTVTDDHDFVIAVQANAKVNIDYNTQALYLRVYRNAYFSSIRHDPTHDYIDVQGVVVKSTNDVLAIQNQYNAAVAKGATYAFVNGYLVDQIDLLTVAVGDVVEYVYDGSIYAVEDIVIGTLPVFDSTLDAKRKYLVHPLQALPDTITYQDDIDVYLFMKDANGRFQGVFFHRNTIDAVRQVTHADLAIAVQPLEAFLNEIPGWTDLNQLTLRLHLRHSGYERPLVYETNRIRELYKLTDTEIVNAMVGVDATVPEWQAAHLEAASYPLIMRSKTLDITPALVQDAFGYNAMCGILAPTPQFVQNLSNLLVVDIPTNLQYRSCVFEYDADGYLLGWYNHTLGGSWTARNPTTKLVEIISGYGVRAIDEVYGQQAGTVDANLDYRFYTCTIVNGAPDNLWRDVTDSGQYVVSGTGLNWLTNATTTYTMVRSNRDFLCYDLALPIQHGALQFSLTSDQNRDIGAANTVMQVSMGELDLWMNGYALVEGIDYIVDFPRVIIISKKYINHTLAMQNIVVRFCGHAQADLTRAVIGDVGFVSHGVLSNNNVFNIRDDKVLHIAVAGGVYDRSELVFAEDYSGVNVVGVPNGSPYVIRDIVVPMRGTTNANTYALRDAALVVDQHVADYLNLKLPPPSYPDPSPITERYAVYSPFVSALIDDLSTHTFNDARIYAQYSNDDVLAMCKPYEVYLPFEPTRAPNQVDSNYVSVQAYYRDVVTNLDLFQYRFLSRAVLLYLNSAVDLSHFVTVTA